MSRVTNLIKQNRIKLGVSQNQLGWSLGYANGQFVSNWENGLASPPVEKLPTILRELKINKTEMIDSFMKDQLELIMWALS